MESFGWDTQDQSMLPRQINRQRESNDDGVVEVHSHSWRAHGEHNGQSVIWHACQLLTHLTLHGASDSPEIEADSQGETDENRNSEHKHNTLKRQMGT